MVDLIHYRITAARRSGFHAHLANLSVAIHIFNPVEAGWLQKAGKNRLDLEILPGQAARSAYPLDPTARPSERISDSTIKLQEDCKVGYLVDSGFLYYHSLYLNVPFYRMAAEGVVCCRTHQILRTTAFSPLFHPGRSNEETQTRQSEYCGSDPA
ncbi:MAG: hypothetical protein GYA20_10015 [Chloroflexi bacterium]|nr:hypothetical protein [Chloroflexota bacterium]